MSDKEYTEAEVVDLAMELLKEKKHDLADEWTEAELKYHAGIDAINIKLDRLIEYRTKIEAISS